MNENNQLRKLQKEAESIIAQIDDKDCNGSSKIYENQNKTAREIVDILINPNKIITVIIALMQSGKTALISAILKWYYRFCLSNNIRPISRHNIYVITGASSKSWIKQMKGRMPSDLAEKIYHRNQLHKLLEEIRLKTDVLIFIDECQIASLESQSISSIFRNAGWNDKDFLLRNNIKIVEISATPDGTLLDLYAWGLHGSTIFMQPGKGYCGPFELLDSNRIFECKELLLSEKQMRDPKLRYQNLMAFKEINDVIKTRFKNIQLYHIIRTPNGMKKSNQLILKFKAFFGDNYEYKRYDQDSEIKHIHDEMKIEPKRHTFIFIKEKLRYSDTLIKINLGIMYERYTKNPPSDSTICQGALGRACGYDDNKITVIFTNISSIEKYRSLWDSNFDKNNKWKSNSTKINKNNLTISKGTAFKPENFGIVTNDDIDNNTNENEPIIEKFKNWQDARSFVLKNIPKTIDKINKNPKNINKIGPQNPFTATDSKMKDGFLECTIRTNRKVYSLEELWCERKCNIDNGAGYSFKYGYKDLSDPKSIEFWILYKI